MAELGTVTLEVVPDTEAFKAALRELIREVVEEVLDERG